MSPMAIDAIPADPFAFYRLTINVGGRIEGLTH